MPPDFLVDGYIAVEVRRLNQHEDTPDGPRGLEHVQARIAPVVKDALQSLGASLPSGSCWYVMCEFRRPLPSWRDLKRAVISALRDIPDPAATSSAWIEVAPNFKVSLWRAGKHYDSRFIFGGFSDHDSGGLVLAEMQRNLLICMEDKKRKVARVRARYPVWWLALADHIGRGLSTDERDQLRALVATGEPWDKVIIVESSSPSDGFEL